jgi:hypothetical protein
MWLLNNGSVSRSKSLPGFFFLASLQQEEETRSAAGCTFAATNNGSVRLLMSR